MNRKTLVLPAVIGLVAPVVAACGGTDGGSGSDNAIVVGTTDRFTATKDAPAPWTLPTPTTSAPGTSCARPYRP